VSSKAFEVADEALADRLDDKTAPHRRSQPFDRRLLTHVTIHPPLTLQERHERKSRKSQGFWGFSAGRLPSESKHWGGCQLL
jgi:hypothetical protein